MDKLNFDRLLINIKYFRWYDYIIVCSTLLIGSVFIALIHHCCKKQRRKSKYYTNTDSSFGYPTHASSSIPSSSANSNEDEVTKESSNLLSPIVVAFALFSSLISGNYILSTSDNIYLYGTQSIVTLITFIFMGLSLSYFYIPVYYNLQLSSAFEYLELRFSKSIRIIASFLTLIQSVIFLTLVTYKTSLSIKWMLSPGINEIVICGIILIIATFCTLIVSLKSILYSNIFYTTVILGTLSAVTGLGIFKADGFETIWEKNLNASRIEFTNFDPDLRAENTIWTSLIAQYFIFCSFFITTHSCAQRLISMKTLFQAKMSMFLLTVLLIILISLCSIIGLIITVIFYDCVPENAAGDKFLTSNFVLNSLSEFPGISGLWLATILCSTICVISNILHGIGTTVICDCIQQCWSKASESKLAILLKIFICMFCGIIFGCQFLIKSYEAYIPMVHSIFLTLIGTIFGLFTLGMFFPWANSKGSILGILTSLSLMGFLIWGSQDLAMNKLIPSQQLPLPNITCQFNQSNLLGNNKITIQAIDGNETEAGLLQNSYEILQFRTNIDEIFAENPFIPKLSTKFSEQWKNQFTSTINNYNKTKNVDLVINYLFSISHVWYPAFSCVITIINGLLFSFLILRRWTKKWKVAQECLSPPMVRLWFKLFPNHLKKWIEPDDDLLFLCSSAFQFMPKGKENDDRIVGKKETTVCDVQIRPYNPNLLVE